MKDLDPRDEMQQRGRDRASGEPSVPVHRDEPALEPAATPPELLARQMLEEPQPPAAGPDHGDELPALEQTIARDERRTVVLQHRLAKAERERSGLEAEVVAARAEQRRVTGELEELLQRLSRFPDRGDGHRR